MSERYEIQPIEIVERTTDGRGRFTLGSEFANQRVKVLVVEADEDGPDAEDGRPVPDKCDRCESSLHQHWATNDEGAALCFDCALY